MSIIEIDLNDKSSLNKIIKLVVKELKGGITFFTGAGISCSAPSSLPTATSIVKYVCTNIAAKLNITLQDLYSHIPNEGLRLEPFLRLVQIYCSNEHIESFFNFLRVSYPNINHFALAKIFNDYQKTNIITLNFDYLIEEALSFISNHTFAVAIPTEEGLEYFNTINKNFSVCNCNNHKIIKLHGSLIKYGGSKGIIATIQTLGKGFSEEVLKILYDCLNNKSLFITGYSDDDIDTFPIIKSSIPNMIFWNSRDKDIPHKIKDWLEKNSKTIKVYHLVGNCENIFNELYTLKNNVPINCFNNITMYDWKKEVDNWINSISIKRLMSIAAWITQDRYRIDKSKILYKKALYQKEATRDYYLNRYIRYRYAELLRHQSKERFSSLKEYILTYFTLLIPPFDIPLFFVIKRSFISIFRSVAHSSKRLIPFITFSSLASVKILVIKIYLTIYKKLSKVKNKVSYEKGEFNWISWETGMVMLGISLKIKMPVKMKLFFLKLAKLNFENSLKSQDIYEKSASMLSLSRVYLSYFKNTQNSDFLKISNNLLNEALGYYTILDDVTGINNYNQMQKAIESTYLDPWLG